MKGLEDYSGEQSFYLRKNLHIYLIYMGCCCFISHNHLFYSIRWFFIALSFITLSYDFRIIDQRVNELAENSKLF